ncbi:MAG: cytochrome P450, partial [Myxococcales bacterium]|nr:cytochrome P450 [Myxococcales bacterium]
MTAEPFVYQPHDPANIADPYPAFARLRAEQPVYYWEQGRSWMLTGYDDVVALLKDPRFTTDARAWQYFQDAQGIPEEVRRYFAKGLFQLDAEGHARVRKLVAPVFTPRRAAAREPMIQQVVDELLERADAEGRGVIDLVPDLADPLPLQVIRRILGISAEHDPAFRAWSLDTIRMVFPGMVPVEELEAAGQRMPAGYALVRSIIEERRAHPGDDLLSAMIQARDEDDRLDEEELVALVTGLVIAGSETTVHLVGRCVINLIRHPEVQARVRADLELLPAFVEEVLRNDNFGLGGVVRYAREDAEVGGTRIAKGEMVSCMLGAAMHDASVFSDPERFDLDRDSTPNISFGRGPHFCLGAHLARTEARVAVQTLLTRFPVLES